MRSWPQVGGARTRPPVKRWRGRFGRACLMTLSVATVVACSSNAPSSVWSEPRGDAGGVPEVIPMDATSPRDGPTDDVVEDEGPTRDTPADAERDSDAVPDEMLDAAEPSEDTSHDDARDRDESTEDVAPVDVIEDADTFPPADDIADDPVVDVHSDTDGSAGDLAEDGDDTATDVQPDVDDVVDPLPATAHELVERLRADRDGTLLDVSRETGWPVWVGDGWFVANTDPGLGLVSGDFDGWSGTPMHDETGFSWAVIPDATLGRYKFNDGERFVADPWSRVYDFDDFGVMSHTPHDGRRLERHFAVGDVELAPRTIHVLVPETPFDRVIYMHDGQNLFDPRVVWGGWRIQASVPEGVLVVGISNSPDRIDEYTHVADMVGGVLMGGRAHAYARFWMETVRPRIRANYGDEGLVGTMGSSLGGLVSLYLALEHPTEVAFAGSLSGTVGWGRRAAENETIIERFAREGRTPTVFYIDSGGGADRCEDTDGDGIWDDGPGNTDNYCENIQLRDTLAALGHVFGVDLHHWYQPFALHNEAAWSARVHRPFAVFAAIEP